MLGTENQYEDLSESEGSSSISESNQIRHIKGRLGKLLYNVREYRLYKSTIYSN